MKPTTSGDVETESPLDRGHSETKGKDAHASTNSSFIWVATMAGPNITATMQDSDASGDGKADLGEVISYQAAVSNAGPSDATGVTFAPSIDANTTFNAGSVHASPIAFNDSYNWVGNTVLDTSARGLGSVTVNDVSVTDTFTLTTLNNAATTQGGSVTMGSHGHFIYTPPVGFTGTDTFNYTIKNSTDATLTSTGTVTINLPVRVWYVQNAPVNGNGLSNNPFNSPVAASTAANASTDIIYIFSDIGANPKVNGNFALDNGQQLIGRGVSLVVNSITLFTASTAPIITNTTGNGITLAAGASNIVSGLIVGNCSGSAIASGVNFGTLTVSGVSVNNGTGQALNLSSGTLSANNGFSGITSTNSSATGITLSGVSGTLSLSSGSTSITNPFGVGIDIQSSSGTFDFSNTSVSGSGGAGVKLVSNSNSTTFADLDITPDANQKAIVATNNTGTITTTSGDITTSGAGNRAIDIDGPAGRTPINITLNSITTSGATSSVSLVDVSGTKFQVMGTTQINTRAGTGVFVDNSMATTIQFATVNIPNPSAAGGNAFHVEDSSSNITVATATISDSSITSAQNDSNNDSFADTDGDGDGIFLRGNTGLFTLNGGTISNPGNDGIDARASRISISGVTITNPGLDVTGATGEGFGGHGIYAMNLTGSNTISGTTISGFNVANRSGLVVNSNAGPAATLTVISSTFQNAVGNTGATSLVNGTGNITLTVGQPGAGCTFSNILASAIVFRSAGAGMLNTTIQNSTFQNSPTNGKTNVTGGTSETAVGNFTIINNIFTNIFKTASTGESAISLTGGNTGGTNTFGVNVSNNIINGVGANSTTCGGGATYCAGPIQAVLIFVDGNTDVNGTILFENNVIVNVQQSALLLDFANAAGGGAVAKITNNCIGKLGTPGTCSGADAIVGSGTNTNVALQNGARVIRRRVGGQSANVLFSNNVIRNGNGSSVTSRNGAGLYAQGAADTTMSITVSNNNIDTLNTNPEIFVESISPAVGDPATQVLCADVSANTINGGMINLTETEGTLNVEQISPAAVAAANGGVTVNVNGSPTFGISCSSPPAMYKPETPPQRDYLARMKSLARPQARQVLTLAPAKSPTLNEEMLTSHGYRTKERASATGSSSIAAHLSKSLWSGAFNPSSLAQAEVKQLAPHVKRNHRIVKARAASKLALTPLLPTPFSLSIGTLPPNKSVMIKFAITVNSSIAPAVSQLSAQGSVSGTNFGDVLTDDFPGTAAPNEPTVTPLSRLDLKLTKTDNVTTTTPDSTLTYVLSYSNPGHSASGVVLTETVPIGTTFNAAGSDMSWVETPSGSGIYKLSLGTLASGATGTKNFAVTVKYPAAAGLASLQNTATIADDGLYEADVNPSDNTATDIDALNAAPAFSLSKTDGVMSTMPGSTLTYTLNYSNTGNQDGTGAVLTETVPVGTTFVSAGSSAWNGCSNGAPAGTICTLAVGNVPVIGGAGSATFVITVNNPATANLASIINSASITDDGANSASAVTANTSDTDTLNATPDLTLTKMPDISNAVPGQTITYTINYSNIGNQGAEGVVITETVPTHTSFSGSNWTCTPDNSAGSTCTKNVGTLAGGGASGSMPFAVTVVTPLPDGATQISNTATIADNDANGPDSNTTNNTTGSVNTPLDTAPTLGNYDDASVLISEGTTITPGAAPMDDKSGLTVGVAASTFTGGISIDQLTGVVSVTNAAPAGTYTVTVTATDNIGQITTKTFQLTVNKSETTTSLISSMNPSFVNQEITFTATATSATSVTGPPTGSVDFFDGVTLVCDDAPLDGSGVATCSTSTLSVAGSPHSMTAKYNGDGTFKTSTSNISSQTINPSLDLTVNEGGDAADLVLDGICDADVAVGEQCTLRAAIHETNNAPSADSIGFSGVSVVTLTNTLPTITGDLTIHGPGPNASNLIVKGNDTFTLMNITGAGVDVTINKLSFEDGGLSSGMNASAIEFNIAGTLTVTDSELYGSSGLGSVLYSNQGTRLTLNRSSIRNNATHGIIVDQTPMDLINSTISNNTGRAATNLNTTLNVTNSTIADNSGGGLSNNSGTLATSTTLVNTLLSNNGGLNLEKSGVQANIFISNGHNLIDDGTHTLFDAPGPDDLLGSTFVAGLAPLSDNGGPTQTRALLSNSAALDAGDNAVTSATVNLTTDQRGTGFKRMLDAADADTTDTVDIGAFEANPMVQDIMDQVTNEDISIACLPLNLGDADEGFSSITAVSSNQTVIPDANLSVNPGSGPSNRCLAITVPANQSGKAIITMTVTGNNGQVVSDAFQMQVTAQNDKPTIVSAGIGDVNVNEDAPDTSITLPTYFGDVEDGGAALVYTIESNTNPGLFTLATISGSNVLTLDYATDKSGTADITVRATDSGGLFIDESLTITITGINDAPSFTKGVDQTASGNKTQTIPNWANNILTGPPDEADQTLSFIISNNNSGLFSVQPSIDPSGTLTFTPINGVNGTATITVELMDNGGTANGGQDTSPQQTFLINISPTGWTTTADSGVTEDESNPARPKYTNFTASPIAGTPAATYVLRYNITAMGNLTSLGAANTRLRVRFRDEGDGSRVVVTIIQSPITGGATAIGTIFDSDTFAPGSGFQTQEILMPALTFNFAQNTYWLEVQLIKTDAANQPGLGSVQINQQ